MSNFQTLTPIVQGVPGDAPRIYSAVTVDDNSTITATGYVNDLYAYNLLKPNDIVFLNYSDTGTTSSFQIYISTLVNTNLNLVAFMTGGINSNKFEVTTSPFQMQPNYTYYINTEDICVLILPPQCNEFDEIRIVSKGPGLFHVEQNSNQQMVFGIYSSTPGTAGYIESQNQYDSVRLVCLIQNQLWSVALGTQGNLTIN